MAEDYGLKSFNGIVFAVLGLMALVLLTAVFLIQRNHPKADKSKTQPSTQSSPLPHPQGP